MQITTDNIGRPVTILETESERISALGMLKGVTRMGVDTESNSMHSFMEKTCTIQVTVEAGHLIFDPLKLDCLDPLGELFAAPGVEKIFHGGVYDLALLSRDFGFSFRGIFDTAISADLLGFPRIGLAALVERYCGVVLEKKFTTSDWGKRPLSPGQQEYLYLDTLYLFEIADRLKEALKNADLTEEAALEFALLEQTPPLKNAHEGKEPPSLKGYDSLENGRERAVLHQVFNWRQQVARQLDRPPFKVLGGHTMLEIARRRPRDRTGFLAIKGLTPRNWGRFGQDILAAVEKGISLPPDNFPPRPRVRRSYPPGSKWDGEFYKELKGWRTKVSEANGVGRIAVLPTRALQEIVRTRPQTVAELGDIEGMGQSRVQKYGQQILALVRNQS